MPISKKNYIHSRNGRIGNGTDHTAADVDSIISELQTSKAKRLIIHFHGGLVSKESGLEIAQRLMPVYSPGGYPLFFVWESGALETVRNNLGDIAKERIFQELVRKVLEFALGKLGFQDGTRSIKGKQVAPDEIKKQVQAWFNNPDVAAVPFSSGVPYADTTARAAAQDIDENEIQVNLEADADFLRALQSVSDVPESTRSALGIAGIQPALTKMDETVLSSIAPREAGATRGLFSLARVAILVAKVLARVIKRSLASRDHGFYATTVEEVLREFYVETIGKAFFWNQMKKDTSDAFENDPNLHVGTAFLSRLKAATENGLQLEKIYLVGHSTGGIYISNFLNAVDAMQFAPSMQFDIVLLAPANTHELFDETIRQHGNRIRWLRMFGMKDSVECNDGLLGDGVARALYPSSLLYFVSGLLEYETDAPVLGMQRFLNEASVFTAQDYPESDRLRTWLSTPIDRLVWSSTDDGDGRCSESHKHGDFDNDAATLKSLAWIVTH